METNVTLIGMPSVGKSTVGVVLAKLTGREFIDTDLLLQRRLGGLLPALIARLGAAGFIAEEGKTLSALSPKNAVIATGGSAVYSEEGMRRLCGVSTVVYLKADPASLKAGLGDFTRRGVVTLGARTVSELYDERAPLYEKYARLTVRKTGDIGETTAAVLRALEEGV